MFRAHTAQLVVCCTSFIGRPCSSSDQSPSYTLRSSHSEPFRSSASVQVRWWCAAASAGASIDSSTGFVAVTPPLQVAVGDGLYTFSLYTVDQAGNAGTTGAMLSFAGLSEHTSSLSACAPYLSSILISVTAIRVPSVCKRLDCTFLKPTSEAVNECKQSIMPLTMSGVACDSNVHSITC